MLVYLSLAHKDPRSTRYRDKEKRISDLHTKNNDELHRMGEDFGDRPNQLKAVFKKFDKEGTGKVPGELMVKLVTKFAGDETSLNAEELKEFITEACDGDPAANSIDYNSFIDNIVFGEVK